VAASSAFGDGVGGSVLIGTTLFWLTSSGMGSFSSFSFFS